MNDPVLIRPMSSTLAGDATSVPVLEISLGATPRGLVLLICGPGDLHRAGPALMNRLAEHGYESIAAETGHGDRGVDVLVARASERDWTAEQIGLLGVGRGGRSVLTVAAERDFAAAVSFCDGAEPNDGTPLRDFDGLIRTPWLGLFGADDPGVTADDLGLLTTQLASRSRVYAQVVSYPRVGADFYRHGEDGPSYAASYDGWQRTIEWLDARVAPRLTPRARRWRERRVDASV
ncbi:dienelactone hydrolase family protein [Nocardia nova]|uniref:Hydrolase n=1 Tax=Nocardia nova TaxID=37330 RepID=A0A2S6A231_9NOCA|nr:dienelactone hydrolase family protein [Nocardia nova]PPJ25569.1 hydrolase [Nocardia nova]